MGKEFFKKLSIGLLFLYCINLVVHISTHSDQHQWDFKVYYYAVKAYAAGLNPYNTSTLSQIVQSPIDLAFVYPPIALLFFRPLSILDYDIAFYLFLIFKFILLMGLIYLWRKEFLVEIDFLFYFFCLLAFNNAIYIDMAAGNVSIIEQFMIWLAFYFYLKRKLLLFCLFILIGATFKLTPSLFLLLLWFSEEKNKYIYFFGSFVLFLAVLVISYIINPLLFVCFTLNAIKLDERGMINPSTFPLVRDSFQLLANNTGVVVPHGVQLAVFLAIIAAIVFLTWRAYILFRSVKVKDKERLELFLACLVYALILPRFKDYSYILLLVPTYFIIKRVNYLKAYPLLFLIITLYSPHMTLPGFNPVFAILWEYYPLIVAYCVWGLYLNEISILIKSPIAVTSHNNG